MSVYSPKHEFTELDNDFITFASKDLLLMQDPIAQQNQTILKERVETCTKLAELGQIEALYMYFMICGGAATNNVVDKNILSLPLSNYSEQRARARYELSMMNKDEYYADYDTYANLGNEAAFYYQNGMTNKHKIANKKWRDFCNMMEQKYTALSLYHKAWEDAYNRSLSNILAQVGGNELICDIISELPQEMFGMDEEGLNIFLKDVSKCKLRLRKEYKRNPDDPQIAYATAKILVLLENNNSMLDNKIANEIFTKLANRPYSDTLQNYQLQGRPLIDDELRDIFGFDTGKNYGASDILKKNAAIKKPTKPDELGNN